MRRARLRDWGPGGLLIGASAALALIGVSVMCPRAHAAATANADPISVPAPQLLNPNDAPAHEDKPMALDPDDDGDDLYSHWSDPIVIVEGQRQIFYLVILLAAAAGVSQLKRIKARKR